MSFCAKCEERALLAGGVMGDGHCPKHGDFPFDNEHLKIFCPSCADEQGLCQMCGEKLEDDEKGSEG